MSTVESVVAEGVAQALDDVVDAFEEVMDVAKGLSQEEDMVQDLSHLALYIGNIVPRLQARLRSRCRGGRKSGQENRKRPSPAPHDPSPEPQEPQDPGPSRPALKKQKMRRSPEGQAPRPSSPEPQGAGPSSPGPSSPGPSSPSPKKRDTWPPEEPHSIAVEVLVDAQSAFMRRDGVQYCIAGKQASAIYLAMTAGGPALPLRNPAKPLRPHDGALAGEWVAATLVATSRKPNVQDGVVVDCILTLKVATCTSIYQNVPAFVACLRAKAAIGQAGPPASPPAAPDPLEVLRAQYSRAATDALRRYMLDTDGVLEGALLYDDALSRIEQAYTEAAGEQLCEEAMLRHSGVREHHAIVRWGELCPEMAAAAVRYSYEQVAGVKSYLRSYCATECVAGVDDQSTALQMRRKLLRKLHTDKSGEEVHGALADIFADVEDWSLAGRGLYKSLVEQLQGADPTALVASVADCRLELGVSVSSKPV